MPNLFGKKFGRLTVLNDDWGGSNCFCVCDCGRTTITKSYSLTSGRTRSCGCLRREVAARKATKHSGVDDPLYYVLNTMHQRCENPKSRDFKWYGAKGVTVCPEWSLSNYSVFRAWAEASGYRPGLTIDRIDPAGNYCPDNCRWVTIQEQQRNRRRRACL